MTENQAILNDEIIVDQPIEDNLQEAAPIENDEVDVDEDNETDEIDSDESDDDTDEEGDETKAPKKVLRALERRNKKINRLRAENAELKQSLASYNQQAEQKQVVTKSIPDGLEMPQEDDFEDYAEYLKAVGKFEVRQEYAQKEAQSTFEREMASQQQWVQQRAAQVDVRAAEAAKNIPELEGLYRENQDIIEGYSNAVKMAFLEADAPEMAFYALAQEGRLEELDGMSPTRVAREIALAEIRGEKLAKTRPQSKAPAPIKPAKATGTRRKNLDDMEPSELIAYLNKQKKGN
jgi:hypothetical protein